MALSVENVAGNDQQDQNNLDFNFTVLNANKIIVFVGITEYTTPAFITFGTDNFSLLSAVSDSYNLTLSAWQLNYPKFQTANLHVDFSGHPTCAFAAAISFIDASPASNTLYNDEGVGPNPSFTVANSEAGNIVISCLVSKLGTGGPLTNNGTIIFGSEDINSIMDGNAQYQTAAGSNTVCSWNAAAPASEGWLAAGLRVQLTTVRDTFLSDRPRSCYSQGNNRVGLFKR
jgi:hypothetical protein